MAKTEAATGALVIQEAWLLVIQEALLTEGRGTPEGTRAASQAAALQPEGLQTAGLQAPAIQAQTPAGPFGSGLSGG